MNLNNIYKTLITICVFTILPAICFAAYFSPDASYDICFTPGDNCAHEIIKVIAQAKQQILVQAYTFTDSSIANALAKAKKNGIDVRIILDKSQTEEPYTLIKFFSDNKIKLIIDSPPDGIAHNKIMIIDKRIVINGSYNYSKNAAKRNVENVIIIKDAEFAQRYVKNWYARAQK